MNCLINGHYLNAPTDCRAPNWTKRNETDTDAVREAQSTTVHLANANEYR